MKHQQGGGRVGSGLILAILMTLVGISVHAQEGGLTETFDDPTLPGWERSSNVKVVDGVLRLEPGSFASYPGSWGGEMLVTLAVHRFGSGAFVLSYHTSESGAYHLVVDEFLIALQRETGTEIEELMSAEAPPIPAGEFVQITIAVSENEHLIRVNGDFVLDAEVDPSALPSGGIAIETPGEAGVEVDSLQLTLPAKTEEPDQPVPMEDSTESGDSSSMAAAGLPALPWVSTGGPSGGLGYDIRMDPRDPDVMYVTDALAGAFKSLDAGENWYPINSGITTRVGPSLDGIPVFSLTIDPNHPDTLWAGTQFGGDVFRSDDGGQNWRSLSNGIQEESLAVRGISIEPGNSDVVYVAGEVSSWEWNGTPLNGLSFDLTRGVVYKTADGGQLWTRLWYGDHLARYIWIHPEDHDRLYVSTGIFDREAANSNPSTHEPGGVGILRSKDGGLSWEELGPSQGFRPEELYFGSLAMHPQDPDILFGAAASDAHQWALDYPTGAVYRSEDGGDSWQRVLDLPNASAVEICETSPDVIYAASVTLFYRSDDGGLTWQQPGVKKGEETAYWGPENIVAGFPIDMQCDPRNPMHIFVNNYGGGNFLSQDGGQTWMNASKGYTGALMDQVVIVPDNPNLVFATARSGIFKSTDGGQEWEGISRGVARAMEAHAVAVNPENPAHLIAIISDAGPVPKITYDGGQTWHEANPELNQVGSFKWETIKKMSFSPTESGRVIGIQGESKCAETNACPDGFGVIFSSDGGETWNLSSLTNGVATELAFAPDGTAYAVIYPSDLYISSNGGEAWEIVSQNISAGISLQDPEPDAPTLALISLAVDPSSPSKLFAGFSRGGVMISEDGGVSWTPSSSGMVPESAIFDLAADVAHPGLIYAASRDSGVYLSSNGGQTWRTINDGLLNRAGLSLALSSDGSVLYLATEGGGVYRLGQSAQSSDELESISAEEPKFNAENDEADPVIAPRGIENPFGGSDLLIGIGIGVVLTVIVVLGGVIVVRRKTTKG